MCGEVLLASTPLRCTVAVCLLLMMPMARPELEGVVLLLWWGGERGGVLGRTGTEMWCFLIFVFSLGTASPVFDSPLLKIYLLIG